MWPCRFDEATTELTRAFGCLCCRCRHCIMVLPRCRRSPGDGCTRRSRAV